MNIPQHFLLQYSAAAISEALHHIGQEITVWATQVKNEEGRELLTMPVLRGGLFLYADLMRQVDCSVEMSTLQSFSYSSDENGVQQRNVDVRLDAGGIEGATVLLVDDIYDSGRTMHALHVRLFELGAKEIRSAVLIRRAGSPPSPHHLWVAFEYPGDEWFVGYGMEDRGRFRNLPDVYLITKDLCGNSLR